jgi:hypothetical protein
METVLGVALVALVLWSYWSIYGSGQYSSKRPPPDLTGFRPKSDNAAPDSSTAQPTDQAAEIGDVSDPV